MILTTLRSGEIAKIVAIEGGKASDKNYYSAEYLKEVLLGWYLLIVVQ